MKTFLVIVRNLFWEIGVVLLSINIFGMFIPLRNPNIYKQETGFIKSATLDAKGAYQVIEKKYENVKNYVTDITVALSQTFVRYWSDDKINEFNLRVPWYKNYIFFFIEKLGWMANPKYEFCDPKKALDRGVGLCSQMSMTLSKLLWSKGIENVVINLKEHVVVTALVDKEKGEWWVLDPDYGVVLEGNLIDVQTNFDLKYRKVYEKIAFREDIVFDREIIIDNIGRIYKNRNYKTDVDLYINSTCELEQRAYFLKWAIPILSLLVGLVLHFVLFPKKRV